MKIISARAYSLSLEDRDLGGKIMPSLVMKAAIASTWKLEIYRMIPSGPSMILQAPHVLINEHGEQYFPLFNHLPDGLYTATVGPIAAPTDASVDLPVPFWIGGGAPANLSEALKNSETEQKAFREREIRHPDFDGDRRTFLHILVNGCYLDYRQNFEGGYLSPLNHRLHPESIVAAINKILPNGVQFSDTTILDESFARENPLCLVTFVNVQASNNAQAADAVNTRLQRILSALAEDRSASPEIIAYLVEDGSNYHLFTPNHIYRGNLIPGFGPSITNMLDLFEKAGQNDPWIDFALSLMRTIRLQRSPETQLFQAWTLIEAAAKRAVPYKDEVITDNAGIPLRGTRNNSLNQKTEFGRVIVYFRDQLGDGEISQKAYDTLLTTYHSRSQIAHEGGIGVPGSQAVTGYGPDLVREIIEMASMVLRHEIVRAAK